ASAAAPLPTSSKEPTSAPLPKITNAMIDKHVLVNPKLGIDSKMAHPTQDACVKAWEAKHGSAARDRVRDRYNTHAGMLPIWLVTTLSTWLVIFIVLYALAALYVAIKFREVRKFLAGAFFVSSGILGYLWLTDTSIPLVMPYVGIVSIST